MALTASHVVRTLVFLLFALCVVSDRVIRFADCNAEWRDALAILTLLYGRVCCVSLMVMLNSAECLVSKYGWTRESPCATRITVNKARHCQVFGGVGVCLARIPLMTAPNSAEVCFYRF